MTTITKTVLGLLFLIVVVFVVSSYKKQNNVPVTNNTVAINNTIATTNTVATTTEVTNRDIQAIRDKPFPLAGMDGLDSTGNPIATSSTIKIKSGIAGTVFLGPVCPVMRNPPDPACADKLYKTKLVVVTKDSHQIVKEFSSDDTGTFNIEIKPGEYMIQNSPSSPMLPRCSSSNIIKVSAVAITRVNVSCDTGIR